MKYGFIGTGNMGGALATACAKAVEPESILLSNRSPEKARALAEKLGASCADNETIARDCDVINWAPFYVACVGRCSFFSKKYKNINNRSVSDSEPKHQARKPAHRRQ